MGRCPVELSAIFWCPSALRAADEIPRWSCVHEGGERVRIGRCSSPGSLNLTSIAVSVTNSATPSWISSTMSSESRRCGDSFRRHGRGRLRVRRRGQQDARTVVCALHRARPGPDPVPLHVRQGADGAVPVVHDVDRRVQRRQRPTSPRTPTSQWWRRRNSKWAGW